MASFYDIVEKVIDKAPLNEFRSFQLFFAMNTEDKKCFHKKFANLSKHLFSPFVISDPVKEKILTVFQKSQKIYRSFCKVAANYKIKRYPINVDRDIYYNKLEKYDKNVINIFQNKQNYLFKTSDLINIIETALCNSHSFFLEPKFPVNPYNNMSFSFADLYNLYFTLKNINCVIPKLFNSFFLSDFNIELFLMDNEMDIKERIIYKYVYSNNDVGVLHMEFRDMMRDYYRNKKCSCCRKIEKIAVDKDFPKKKLIEIMKPYLYLHCTVKYSIEGLDKIDNYRVILKKKLKEFVKFNPMFGRKYVKHVNNKAETHFDDKHEKFTLNEIKRWGQKSYVVDVSPPIMSFRPQLNEPEQREYVEYNDMSDSDSDSDSENGLEEVGPGSEGGDDYDDTDADDYDDVDVDDYDDVDADEHEVNNDEEIMNNNSRVIVPNYPLMPPDLLSLPFPGTMYIRRQVSEVAERIIEVPIIRRRNNMEIEEGEIVEENASENVNNNFYESFISDISSQIIALQEIQRTHGPINIGNVRYILSSIAFPSRSIRSGTLNILMDFFERNFSYPNNEFIEEENENDDNGSLG